MHGAADNLTPHNILLLVKPKMDVFYLDLCLGSTWASGNNKDILFVVGFNTYHPLVYSIAQCHWSLYM